MIYVLAATSSVMIAASVLLLTPVVTRSQRKPDLLIILNLTLLDPR